VAKRSRTARTMGVAAAALALGLAGCGSSSKTKSATTTTSSAAATTTTSTVASTTTTAPLSPALPAPATTGALTISSTTAIPLPTGIPVVAEAPDGAVFVAAESATPVYVLDGNQPAAVAEHVTGGVRALGADAANLYAANYSAAATTVYSYNRTTGSQVHQWTLPGVNSANTSDEDLVGLIPAGGALWVTIVAGNDTDIYRIHPSSASAATPIATSLADAAIGPDGSAYYALAGHQLMRRAPSGQVTTGPALLDSPNSEGGGVQFIDVIAGGRVWVQEPDGQGTDAGYATFDAMTLAATGTFQGSISERTIVDTLAGPLDLAGSEAASACTEQAATPGGQCVLRISTSGVLSDPTPVGGATALVGPYPAVVTDNAASTGLQLDRLS